MQKKGEGKQHTAQQAQYDVWHPQPVVGLPECEAERGFVLDT